jgi:hypothetical protein
LTIDTEFAFVFSLESKYAKYEEKYPGLADENLKVSGL